MVIYTCALSAQCTYRGASLVLMKLATNGREIGGDGKTKIPSFHRDLQSLGRHVEMNDADECYLTAPPRSFSDQANMAIGGDHHHREQQTDAKVQE